MRDNSIKNNPFDESDADAAEDIFGPDIQCLKGKKTRTRSSHVHLPKINVHTMILSRYKIVTVAGDVMFINGLRFFVSKSRNIKFTTGEYIKNAKEDTLFNSIMQLKSMYKSRGFYLKHLLLDGKFLFLEQRLLGEGIHLNVCSNDEHFGVVERVIRTIKERVRGIYVTLPSNKLPGRMIVELVYFCIFWLNAIHPSATIVPNISPRTIMTGKKINYNVHCKHEFGEYVQTHEEHDNTMQTRTVGAIALRPTRNVKGGHFYLSLATGRRLNRLNATPLLMSQEVIKRVHNLAKKTQRV